MAAIDLKLLTIPLPQPYDDKDPDRQRENWAYVKLQVADLIKQAVIADPVSAGLLEIDLVSAIHALQFNHATVKIGDVEIVLTSSTASVDIA
jgi:hypothetical protein